MLPFVEGAFDVLKVLPGLSTPTNGPFTTGPITFSVGGSRTRSTETIMVIALAVIASILLINLLISRK